MRAYLRTQLLHLFPFLFRLPLRYLLCWYLNRNIIRVRILDDLLHCHTRRSTLSFFLLSDPARKLHLFLRPLELFLLAQPSLLRLNGLLEQGRVCCDRWIVRRTLMWGGYGSEGDMVAKVGYLGLLNCSLTTRCLGR